MRFHNILCAIVPFILVTACSAADHSQVPEEQTVNADNAVVGGAPDHGKHPAVVALLLGGEALCSGTLIAPDAVLTARHCVSETNESVQCPPNGPQIVGNRPANSIAVMVGETVGTAQEMARGKSLEVLPYDDLCGKDIAVIRLDRPITAIKPASIRLSEAVATNDKVDLVGFGKRGDYAAVGEKYCRRGIKALDATEREFLTAESSCSGDSGGPAFDHKTGDVVGVVSRGGPVCEGPEARNIYTQVSAFRELLVEFETPDTKDAGIIGNTSDGGLIGCGSGTRCPKGSHCGTDHFCHAISK
jgi:secreted trypsin-like serine protease